MQKTRTSTTMTKTTNTRILVAMRVRATSILMRIAIAERRRRITMVMKSVMRMILWMPRKRTTTRQSLSRQHPSPAACSTLHRVATPLDRLFRLLRPRRSLAVQHPSLPSLTLRLDRRATRLPSLVAVVAVVDLEASRDLAQVHQQQQHHRPTSLGRAVAIFLISRCRPC